MTKTFCVYEHWRPDTDVCFYVGKGSLTRAQSIERGNRHHTFIVRKLLSSGYLVKVRIVQKGLTEAEAFELEIRRIAQWRATGLQLTNATDGGEGPSGYKHTEEARQAIRKAHTGRKRSPETCRRISLGVKGKTLGRKSRPETCAKIRLALTGKKRTVEQRLILSRAKIGVPQKPHTQAHNARIGASLRGRKDTEETLARKRVAGVRQAEARRGTPENEVAKSKIAATVKVLWSNPDYRSRMVASHVGHEPSEEARANMRAGQAKRGPRTAEHCAKISAAIKKKHAERRLRESNAPANS